MEVIYMLGGTKETFVLSQGLCMLDIEGGEKLK